MLSLDAGGRCEYSPLFTKLRPLISRMRGIVSRTRRKLEMGCNPSNAIRGAEWTRRIYSSRGSGIGMRDERPRCRHSASGALGDAPGCWLCVQYIALFPKIGFSP